MIGYILKGLGGYNSQSESFTGKTEEHLISGAFLINFEFTHLPNDLFKDIKETDMEGTLSFLAYNISVPEMSLETVPYKTVKYFNINVPGKINYGSQTFNIRFYETNTGTISKFFTNWFMFLRPPAHFDRPSIKNSKLKANIMVSFVDRYLKEVPFSVIYVGCFPTKVPTDSFTFDIMSRNIVVTDIPFSYDTILISKDVTEKAENNLKESREKIKELYGDLLI